MHCGVHNTTGNISSSCLLFLPLFCPREAERKTEANQTEQAKEKHNRRKRRRTKWESWERGEITSLHPCSCVLAQSLAFPLAGREWCEKPVAEQGTASPGVIYHCKQCLCLLRAGKQFSDKENHFSSWGQPKHSGAYSEPSLMIPEPRCPSAVLCLLCSCDVPAPKCLRNFKASGNIHPMFRKFSIPQTPRSVSHLGSGASTSCVFQHSSDHGAFLLHPALLLISRLYFKCFAADPRRNKPKSQLPQKQSPESMTR